ncbi:MAG: hypothetical protein WBP45_13820, partial [Daejeonella sp.]
MNRLLKVLIPFVAGVVIGAIVIVFNLFPYSFYNSIKETRRKESVNYIEEYYYSSKKVLDHDIKIDSVSSRAFRLALGFPLLDESVGYVKLDSTQVFSDSVYYNSGELILSDNFRYRVIRASRNYEAKLPIIIIMHGRGSSADKILGLENEDYARGVGYEFASNNYEVWVIGVNPSGSNETFAKELYSKGISSVGIDLYAIECLLRKLKDSSRYTGVYGISYGGYLAELTSTLTVKPDFIVSSGGGFRGNFDGFSPIGGYFYKYPPVLGLFYNSNLYIRFMKDIP